MTRERVLPRWQQNPQNTHIVASPESPITLNQNPLRLEQHREVMSTVGGPGHDMNLSEFLGQGAGLLYDA